MESVLNKLVDRVSTTVYQVTSNISTALPGNALTREYDLIQHLGSAGPCLTWKIYDAIKKSTKQEASLFVFDKKQLDRCNKKDKELILEIFKKGVSQLTRLRHPSMLIVQHALEESRDLLAFATEPVIGSLANFLGNRENMPSPLPHHFDNFEFYDVEIKYGLLQISEGLSFLHNDVKMLHRNLSPENIIINKNGAWKISGFDFCILAKNSNETPLKFNPFNLINCNDIPPMALPNFDYVAPEFLEKNCEFVESSADMFSLGALTYTLYNKGTALLPTNGLINYSRFNQLKKLPQSTYNCIPDDSRNHIKLLLSVDPNLRPDAVQFSKLHFFEDILVKTLQYLDALFQWDNLHKSHFYKGLPEILSKMPKRVKLNRIVSCLSKEFVNPDMVPFVLPNILLIAEESTDEEFQKWIFPELINVFKMQEPIQVGIILMQKMEFLVNKCKSNPDALKEHILPLIYRSLESDAKQIQELCLNVIPCLAHLIDYSSMKNSLLPRLKKLILNTNLLSVRVNCLVCIGKILDHLDKWLVLDDVFPTLTEVPSREPAVIMAIVGIYKLSLASNKIGITKDIMATKVIPFLAPLSIENGLSLQQFQSIMALIREMLSKVEDEQLIKLEQLNSIKNQQQTLFNSGNNLTKISPSVSLDGFDGFPDIQLNQNRNVNSSSGLSLEEKERLAREKEQNEILKSQTALIPQPVKKPETHKPKDLTSTLINSNLANLSLNPSMNLSSINNPQSSMSLNYNSNVSSQLLNQFQPFQSSHQQFNSFNQNIKPSVTSNISALDNLVIPDLKKSHPQPMKSMISTSNNSNNSNNSSGWPPIGSNLMGNQLPNYNSNSTSTTKTLSKSELDDFLN